MSNWDDMTLDFALDTLREVSGYRADMWREAANGYLAGSAELDCFYEADSDECNNMAAMIDKAVEVVEKFQDNFNTLEAENRRIMEAQIEVNRLVSIKIDGFKKTITALEAKLEKDPG